MNKRQLFIVLMVAAAAAATIAFLTRQITPSSSDSTPTVSNNPEAGIIIQDGALWSVDAQGTPIAAVTDSHDIQVVFAIAKGVWWLGRLDEEANPDAVAFTLARWDSTTGQLEDLAVPPVIRTTVADTGAVLVYETAEFGLVHRDIATGTDTALPVVGTEPELSSDGSQLAFVEIESAGQSTEASLAALGLRVLDLTTKEVRTLSDNPEDFNPLWTPDDQSLIVGSANPEDGTNVGLFRVSVVDGTRQRIIGEDSPTLSSEFMFPSERPLFVQNGAALQYVSDSTLWLAPLQQSDVAILTNDIEATFRSRSGDRLFVVETTNDQPRLSNELVIE